MVFNDADALLIVAAINAVRRGTRFPVELRDDRGSLVFLSQLVRAYQALLSAVSSLPTFAESGIIY